MSYQIDQNRCNFCGGCASVCPQMAIEIYDHSALINSNCIQCSICYQFCPLKAIIQKTKKGISTL